MTRKQARYIISRSVDINGLFYCDKAFRLIPIAVAWYAIDVRFGKRKARENP
jgi:hypothetical protein